MKISINPAKNEVISKQYLRSILDISENHTVLANVVVPGSGIQVSQHRKKVVCWDLISHCLHLCLLHQHLQWELSTLSLSPDLEQSRSWWYPLGECPLHFPAQDRGHPICPSMVGYGMVWYGMVWYGMLWYGMVWYGMAWHGMAWHGTVWYGRP